MTIAWTEDNFLERMTHRARRAADACPDAQTMDAYVQGAAGGFVGGIENLDDHNVFSEG